MLWGREHSRWERYWWINYLRKPIALTWISWWLKKWNISLSSRKGVWVKLRLMCEEYHPLLKIYNKLIQKEKGRHIRHSQETLTRRSNYGFSLIYYTAGYSSWVEFAYWSKVSVVNRLGKTHLEVGVYGGFERGRVLCPSRADVASCAWWWKGDAQYAQTLPPRLFCSISVTNTWRSRPPVLKQRCADKGLTPFRSLR